MLPWSYHLELDSIGHILVWHRQETQKELQSSWVTKSYVEMPKRRFHLEIFGGFWLQQGIFAYQNMMMPVHL
jgi:hypothetical protein